MTPRKWTAADVTQDDVHFFDETCVNCVGYSPWKGGWDDVDMANLVAACWSRLEEKRSSPEITRLREIRDAALARLLTDFGSHHIKVEQYKEAEANLRAACGSDSLESEQQDPFFDADHLAEVGAYMEERARKKLLAQALEALRTAYGYTHGGHIDREDAKEVKEAIAALEKEVGASEMA